MSKGTYILFEDKNGNIYEFDEQMYGYGFTDIMSKSDTYIYDVVPLSDRSKRYKVNLSSVLTKFFEHINEIKKEWKAIDPNDFREDILRRVMKDKTFILENEENVVEVMAVEIRPSFS